MLALLVPSGASAAVHLDSIGTFNAPVHVASLPGEPDRLLVVEQGGTIQLVDHGVASTFLDLTNPRIVSAGGERGLLSVAPAPDYATSHHLYVYFTNTGGSIEIDEFTADGDSVPLSSRRPLLVIPHPTFANHNGGQLQFGPDGMLYVGTGDGGSAGDPSGNAQNLNSLLGKILRIDPTPPARRRTRCRPTIRSAGSPIWSYGLRNPWRFSFDRMTGDLLIGDVGQNAVRGDRLSGAARCRARGQLRLGLPRGVQRVLAPAPSCDGTTGFVDPDLRGRPQNGLARSSAATSSATRASATSTAATSSATPATGRSARSRPAHRRDRRAPSEGLDGDRALELRRGLLRAPLRRLAGRRRRLAVRGRRPGAVPVGRRPGGGGDDLRCGGEPATRTVAADGSVKGSPGDDVIVGDQAQQQDPIRRRRRSDLRRRRPRQDPLGRGRR